MKIQHFGTVGRVIAISAIVVFSSQSPLQAQSRIAMCTSAAAESCTATIEGYSSFTQCVAVERQYCLDGIPSPRDLRECEINDYSCGMA